MLKGNGWSEIVDVRSKWHDVVKVTHKLSHFPEGVALVADATQSGSESKVGESIPANVGDSAKNGVHWIPLSISAAATVTGVVLAVVGNSKAKKAADRNSRYLDDLEKDLDDAKSGQTLRGVGIGLAIAGAVGVGFSFAF